MSFHFGDDDAVAPLSLNSSLRSSSGFGKARRGLRKSSTVFHLKHQLNPDWELEGGRVQPHLTEACSAAYQRVRERLPLGEEALRALRGRMPQNGFEKRLAKGESLASVARIAALQVIEKWLRLLRPKVPEPDMSTCVAKLVHNMKISPPGDPLGDAVHRLVPKPAEVEMFGFPFVADSLGVMALEQKLDPGSFVLAPPVQRLPERRKLSVICGKALPVWDRPDEEPIAPWRRSIKLPKHAAMSAMTPGGGCDGEVQAARPQKTVPGKSESALGAGPGPAPRRTSALFGTLLGL